VRPANTARSASGAPPASIGRISRPKAAASARLSTAAHGAIFWTLGAMVLVMVAFPWYDPLLF
jgi:hypothetical protein